MSDKNQIRPSLPARGSFPLTRSEKAIPLDAVFDEQAYLRANGDVAAAIKRGEVASALEHYRTIGAREGRKLHAVDGEPRGQMVVSRSPAPTAENPPAYVNSSFEGLFISREGAVMIVGWVDDSDDPLEFVSIAGNNWKAVFDSDHLARIRRTDVEEALDRKLQQPFGFFGLVYGGTPIGADDQCQVEIRLKSGAGSSVVVKSRAYSAGELRNLVLSYLSGADHFGNPHIRALGCLDRGLGPNIVALNRSIINQIIAAPYVERFGDVNVDLVGSIVVCLFGKVEFLFLQMALYAGLPGIENYEFIYVCNSPELSEALLREARNSVLVYGLPITVVLLSGNAGFGAANNAAAAAARTDRLLIVNPDVFPKDADWARKHTDLLRSRPAHETRLFGVPLYYDDGSLMHGGMFFEQDTGVSFNGRTSAPWRFLRVEHYGKGAPVGNPFTQARPVPAVTGAFISVHRAWFEKIDGFTLDYVFGHYEDADLCLKSLSTGVTPYLHDLRLWHMEGKGSTRLPVHEGGSLVNRWVFSSRWGAVCDDGLLGPSPTHRALQPIRSDVAGRSLGQSGRAAAPRRLPQP